MKLKKVLVTKEKLEELKLDLKSLKSRRKILDKTLEEVRSDDVSEEGDSVITVTGEIAAVDKRISEIEETIDNATLIEKKKCNAEEIGIGSKITLLVNDKKVQYTLLSAVESDPLSNKISEDSPLGKQLLKSKKGDTIKTNIGGRKIEYKILDVC